MPLSFASILGGVVTLIGTPPNIVIATFRDDALGAPFTMFDFAPVGLAVAAAAPALWFLLASLFTDSVADAVTNPILGPAALVVGVVSIPTVLRMLIDMFVPGFRSYTDQRLLFGGLEP